MALAWEPCHRLIAVIRRYGGAILGLWGLVRCHMLCDLWEFLLTVTSAEEMAVQEAW
jgi:hypothetical protein